MAASYNKFNVFVANIMNGVHNLSSDTLNLWLTNTAPNAADIKIDTTATPGNLLSTSNAVEVAAGDGYSKNGAGITVTTNSQTSGTYTLAGDEVVWTSVTGNMGTFRYIVLYDITAGTTSTRPVIGWWDYGSSLTLNGANGDTFTVLFNNANPGTIFTCV